MHGWPRDTSPDAIRKQHEILRRMSFRQKMDQVDGLWDLLRALTMSRLRKRYPEATEHELIEHFFRARLGPELGEKVLEARRARLKSA